MSTVAGLPQYVVLRSKTNGNYLQYQWNDEFTDFYKFMGAKRAVDEVSPFVKLEVVPDRVKDAGPRSSVFNMSAFSFSLHKGLG
ncbi:hypothetical protein LINPERPRIM_LOCUS39385 [Linum perenne]